MDGSEWKATRQNMNPVFLKKNFYEKFALPWSNTITDLLIEEWLTAFQNVLDGGRNGSPVQIDNLEGRLHRWSVESILASLFGEAFLSLGKHKEINVTTANPLV